MLSGQGIAFLAIIESMQARILTLLRPEASACNATFQLSRILQGRGDRVVYATRRRWELFVSRQGFETVFLDAPLLLLTRAVERGCPSGVRQEASERLR